MRLSKRHRWHRRLALGLAVAAVAAPSAQAITPRGASEFPTWTVNWAQPKAPESPAAAPTGFDYGDAGIGAAIAFGAALLAAAGFLGLRRSRRPASPA
jgi:hypothetical protein